MNKIIALYRVTKKCAKNEEKSKLSSTIGNGILGVLLVALFGAGGYFSGLLMPAVAQMMPGVNVPTNLFTLIFWVSGMSILFMVTPTLLGAMFMSSDVEVLAAMPLSGSQIAITRVLPSTTVAYMCVAGLTLPFCIGYFITAGFSVTLLVATLVNLLITPVGVISILAIVLTLIMKFFKQVRNRDMLTVLGSIGAIVVIVLINIVTNTATSAALDSSQGASVLSSLVNASTMAWSLPFTALLGKAIADGPLFMLAAVAVVAVLAALLYVVLGRLYMPAALGMADAHSSAKALNDEQLERGSMSRSVNKALLYKEFKCFFTESKFLQGWIFAIGMPVFLLILPMFGAQDGSAPVGFVSAAIEATKLPVAYSILLGVAMAISAVGFAACLTTVGTSCISREGEMFDFMKTCPVEYRAQLNAKRKITALTLGVSAVLYQLGVFGIAIVFGTMTFVTLAAALITDVFVAVLFANLQLRTAARKADVHWMNVQTVLKVPGVWLAIGIILFMLGLVLAMGIGYFGTFAEELHLTFWIYVGSAVLVVLLALAAFLTTKPCLRYAAEKVDSLS